MRFNDLPRLIPVLEAFRRRIGQKKGVFAQQSFLRAVCSGLGLLKFLQWKLLSSAQRRELEPQPVVAADHSVQHGWMHPGKHTLRKISMAAYNPSCVGRAASGSDCTRSMKLDIGSSGSLPISASSSFKKQPESTKITTLSNFNKNLQEHTEALSDGRSQMMVSTRDLFLLMCKTSEH
ncbi:hypothetical protein M5K25_006002 [Dendrobium thyrsiflorum]|uniref:Uncharacterized protein n=1 Tax=Dendrobium thyrsiflorum TaxID=117978 RepID=A0ABD0VHP8_DENTH